MINELSYSQLQELYETSKLEVSKLKDKLEQLETQNALKNDFRLSHLIFNDAVKKFVNLLPIVIFQADIDGKFLFLNEYALKSFGFTATDFEKGMNIREVLADEDSFESIREGIRNKLKTEELEGDAYTLKKKNGDLFYGLIYSTAHIGDDNYPIIFGIIVDHTEYQNVYDQLLVTQKELKELNTAKDKLFSIIAHDLKNPFNSISGFSELILSDIHTYSTEQLESYIKIIHKSSVKGYNLLENLLDWTRSQTGNLIIKKENFMLSDLIKENIDLNIEKAIVKEIELTASCDNSLFVYADKNMINTVMRNLITNALKFTDKGGTIQILAAKYNAPDLLNTYVKVSIKDSGIGIKKPILDKLFKFEESHTTKGTDFEQGTGLGLTLCRDFVEKNGGEIWADSEYGKGSVFNFTLPYPND